MLNAGIASLFAVQKENVERVRATHKLNQNWERPDKSQYDGNLDLFEPMQLHQTSQSIQRASGQVRVDSQGWLSRADVASRRPLRPGDAPFFEEATAHKWLKDALEELSDCPEAAVEEGMDEPSALGLQKAEAVLRGMSGLVEERPDIYPMDRGAIVIDLRSPGSGSSVLMVIEHDGSGALFYRTSRKKGRVRVDDAVDLLSEAGLLEIGKAGGR